MRLLVCVSHLVVKGRALGSQDRRVVLGDRIDGLVVDLRILVHEPVAKADDEARVRDAGGELRVARESTPTASPMIVNSRSTEVRTARRAR
jgi:hypothetical protein